MQRFQCRQARTVRPSLSLQSSKAYPECEGLILPRIQDAHDTFSYALAIALIFRPSSKALNPIRISLGSIYKGLEFVELVTLLVQRNEPIHQHKQLQDHVINLQFVQLHPAQGYQPV
ncbi:hypothetical protein TWF102_008476 [Orbilia oligospora]|uniref:Uncharacterized protein n=1 Tax=Orbilia oligospora TaxID=2813651 RepID=A0A7C8JHM4_ORBOL|nr:hypothetical protein TWF102_008476 [Orbilia oligospora]